MCSLPSNVSTFKADLHVHSSCSDGTYSPRELIDLAAISGLQALCITDHDTVDAYKELFPYAAEKGVRLGVGMEMSCVFDRHSVHILGYDFPVEHPLIEQYCIEQKTRRYERNQAILQRLGRLGLVVTEEELCLAFPKTSILGRPHIAALLCQKGYVHSIKEAFHLYLAEKRCCYVAGSFLSVQEGISLLRKSGAKALLAHPHHYQETDLIDTLLSLDWDGIECFYGQCQRYYGRNWLEIAAKKHWLRGGGSDFHGVPGTFLGSSYVEEADFFRIFSTQNEQRS